MRMCEGVARAAGRSAPGAQCRCQGRRACSVGVLQRDGIDEAHLQRLVRAVELAEEPDLARLEMRGAAAWAHKAADWAHAA